MSLTRLPLLFATVCVLALVAAGCGPTGDGDPTPTPTPTPTSPPPPQTAATDCSSSDQVLPSASSLPGVSLTLSTDPTQTSLLMKNTGQLTAVVIPDEARTTRITTAPYANPDDEVAAAALEAVAKSGFAAHVPGLPPDIPVDQVYVVPPDWAVCALTDRLGVSARTRYLRDKVSSAQYRTAKYLGDQLVSFITPSQLKSSRSLVSCAKGAQNAVEGYPDLDGLDLYERVIGTGTACWDTYKRLLANDEEARTAQSKALTVLEKSPKLLRTSKFLLALVHR